MNLLVDDTIFDPAGPTLFASKCEGCGAAHFPPRTACPDCFTGQVERVAVSGEATLGGFTAVRLSDPGLVSPCIVGEIHLRDGPRLYALLDGVTDISEVRYGMPLSLVAGVVRRDDGEDTVGYRFKPA